MQHHINNAPHRSS